MVISNNGYFCYAASQNQYLNLCNVLRCLATQEKKRGGPIWNRDPWGDWKLMASASKI